LDPLESRAELDRLSEQLSARQSVTCFAQSAIALVLALIFAGTAAKLFWDSLRTPLLGAAASALAAGLVVYAVIRYLRGKRLLRTELAGFERLQGLRRELKLDDPSALLPGR
jgi:hypothetical protein